MKPRQHGARGWWEGASVMFRSLCVVIYSWWLFSNIKVWCRNYLSLPNCSFRLRLNLVLRHQRLSLHFALGFVFEIQAIACPEWSAGRLCSTTVYVGRMDGTYPCSRCGAFGRCGNLDRLWSKHRPPSQGGAGWGRVVGITFVFFGLL